MKMKFTLLLMLLQIAFHTVWAQKIDFSEQLISSGSVTQTTAEKFPITWCNGSFIAGENFTTFRGEAYFCATHHEKGRELFRTNGTTAGTKLVFDIDKGPGSSDPDSFFELNGHLFFFAENTLQGNSLWRTDGSSTNTKRIKGIPDAESTKVKLVHIGSDYVIFQVNADTSSSLPPLLGKNLWRTDGTSAGTYKLDAEVYGGLVRTFGQNISASSFYKQGDSLFYSTLNTIYQLDLITNTSQPIKTFSTITDDEFQLQILSGQENGGFLITFSDGYPRQELWESNGTANGTVKLFSDVTIMGVFGDNILACSADNKDLLALNKIKAEVLYRFENSDECRKQVNYSAWSLTDNILITTNDGAIFTDFTSKGTSRFDADSLFGYGATNDKVVFANGCCGPEELFSSDGTTLGTKRIRSFTGTQNPSFLRGQSRSTLNAPNYVFFNVFPGKGRQLWRTDGSQNGTAAIRTMHEEYDYVGREGQRHYLSVGSTYDNPLEQDNYDIWHTDGTSKGTYQLFYPNENFIKPDDDLKDGMFFQLIYYLLLVDEDK